MWKLILLAMFGITSAAHGQVVYAPLQFEYGTGAGKFYYGGSDPAVIARAERAGRMIELTNRRGVALPIRVYSDLLPYHSNAALFGFTANDARNEAYQSQSRYVRMSDLRPAAIVVEPTPEPYVRGRGTIEIKPYVRPASTK